MNVSMQHSKSTKGTHVYTNADEKAFISSLYIKRDALPTEPPKEIKIEVTFTS